MQLPRMRFLSDSDWSSFLKLGMHLTAVSKKSSSFSSPYELLSAVAEGLGTRWGWGSRIFGVPSCKLSGGLESSGMFEV